jgi:[ribosomal protein S18]-alanine N-acetyltransferase
MIRKMNEDDIIQVVKLESEHLGQTLGAAFFLNELTYHPSPYYLVYELGKEIIGYIGYRLHEKQAEMMNFVVKENYQHQGYGSALFEQSLEYFKINNIKTISLEVRKNNFKARSFYEKQGFIMSHIKYKYYDHEDGIVYIKEVS